MMDPSHSTFPFPSSETFPYEVLEKVGEGAMGEVFRADDLHLQRRVAIKLVKLGGSSPQAARELVHRFLQEARAAAAIAHAGVPIIYRVGVEEGWPFIVMEWIDGATLEGMLEQGRRFSAEEAARLGIEALAALEAAHAAGIVHRDIKPGNLMVTRDGHVKVTDFGIARVMGERALAQTDAGAIIGTPLYAAPEQLMGRAVDRRADLYGVGCVLYEAVTGVPPHRAGSLFDLVREISEEDPPAPGERATGIPPAFDVIVQRALALEPDDRFASARDMAAALGQLVRVPTATPLPLPTPRVQGAACRGPTIVVDGATTVELVTQVMRGWPATPLGPCSTSVLLERIAERPLHAAPFSGAVEIAGAVLLVARGLIHAAFELRCGHRDDDLLERLPAEVDAILRPVPEHLGPDVIPSLASLLLEPRVRQANLDASLTDLAGLARQLMANSFDGALRFTCGDALGFAMFRNGKCVLDVFGRGWTAAPERHAWEHWIAGTGARASVEELRVEFPAVVFRQQLRGVKLQVTRPPPATSSAVRSDAVADARATELRLLEAPGMTETTAARYAGLIAVDPAHATMRYVLTELPLQFMQYGRAARWRTLVEPMEAVSIVRLHHGLDAHLPFDAVTIDAAQRWCHVVDRVAHGSAGAVAAFLAKVRAAKVSHDHLGGAVLVAPRFDDAAIAAYLRGLAESRSRLDALRHREGFLRIGSGGLHVLLVEEQGSRRRPLVFE